MPIGTLMKNPARHEKRDAAAPPTTMPRLAPMPAAAEYHATARLRSSPSKLAVMSASDDGATIAAPIPCRARAAMMSQDAGAIAISSDAVEKMMSPVMNTGLRPSRSPARAPTSSRPPKTSV